MSDLAWTGVWLAILVGGIGACVGLRATGLASTYVRDLLHVGAGVWVLGWPWWDHAAPPIAIAAAVAGAIAVVPVAARRVTLIGRIRDSVSGGDERWTGLILYALAFTAFTAVGVVGAPFPAAAGLLALSLGDGLGGAAGRRFGRHRYAAPWGKPKSLEGSAVVAAGAAVGIAGAAAWSGVAIAPAAVIALALAAALTEALAPRSTDNLLVPAVVCTGALFA